MTASRAQLRSLRPCLINRQGDALRLGMDWAEEDLGKPQVLVDGAYGHGHPSRATRAVETSWRWPAC